MPAHHSLHVALTRELCDFVTRLVASGRYQSSSEVVRSALRLLERTEDQSIKSQADSRPSPETSNIDDLAR
jgi:antitoxin ParD1/3/4